MRVLEDRIQNGATPGEQLQHLSPELRALCEGIRGRPPDSADLNWEKVGRLAVVHGVAPLLHAAWHGAPGPVPAALLDDFKRLRQRGAVHGVLAMRQRDEILAILRQADIRYLVLKGAALARVWYGELSLRSFIDIDLLLPMGEIARAREALIREGYRDISDFETAHGMVPLRSPHHVLPLYRAGMPCSIELHYGLTRLQIPDPLPFEDLYACSITPQGEPGSVRTLGPEDMLRLLCLHLLSHVDYDYGWQLRQACDIARHLDAFQVDWQVFSERAAAVGVLRGCAAVLGLAELLAGATVPPEQTDEPCARELVRHPLPGEIEHRFLANFLAALGRLDLQHAATMVFEAMVDRETEGRIQLSDIRPLRLFPIIRRLAHQSVNEPAQLTRQLRVWLPETGKRRRREQLLADLLTTPGTSAAARRRSILAGLGRRRQSGPR